MMTEIFSMSLDAMKTFKVRTFLTLIGIVIGIGSVIIVTTAGNSVNAFVEKQWNIFDPAGMVIGVGRAGNPPQLSLIESVFTDTDVENLDKLPNVKNIAPVGLVSIKKIMKKEGFLQWESQFGGAMYATTPVLLDILELEIEEGRVFQDGKKEVVIGKSIAELFGQDTPLALGDILYLQRIDGRIIKAKIVGILKEKENVNIASQLTTPSIIGPVDPYYSSFFGSNVGGPVINRVTAYGILYATATSKENVPVTEQEVLSYLNSDQSDAQGYKDDTSDFVIITQQYIISKINQLTDVQNMFITAVALISLIVGGIGIANIMFATVTERTREIGTLKALGAKRKDILRLFLYQATIIGLLGGIFGCIAGAFGGTLVIDILNRSISGLGGTYVSGEITLLYSFEWFFIATIVGIVIGIAAGVLPARKAARLDPVQALKYE